MMTVQICTMRSIVVALTILAVGCGASSSQQTMPNAPTQTSPPTAPAPDPPGTVRGRTIDYSTGLPVEGISVGFGNVSTVSGSSGVYSLIVPPGAYSPTINGAVVGSAVVTEIQYAGDLLVNGGSCIARYGMTEDATTRMPLEGVAVSLSGHTITTGSNGWFRFDFGCPTEFGYNTTFIYATKSGYSAYSRVVGEGLTKVLRFDVAMQPNQ